MANMVKKSNNSVGSSIGNSAKPKTKFSEFDLSRMKFMNLNEGAIIPLDVFPVVPKTRIKKLSYDLSVLTRNPTVRQYRGGFRVYVKSFYSKSTDLWEGAEIFYNPEKDTPELSQYADLQIPKYEPCNLFVKTDNLDNGVLSGKVDSYTHTTLTPFSPLGYMGVPCAYLGLATKDFVARSLHGAIIRADGEHFESGSTLEKALFMPPSDNLSSGNTVYSHLGFDYDDNTSNVGTTYRYFNGEGFMGYGMMYPFRVANSYTWDDVNKTAIPTSNSNPHPELEYMNHINALPLVMYTRIYRDFFMNKSLMTQYPNTYKLWYPTKSEDFRLPIDPKNIKVDGCYALPGQSAYTSTWDESTDVGFRLGYEEHNQVNCVSLKHPLLPNKAVNDLLGGTHDNPIYPVLDALEFFKDNIINASNDDTLPIPPLLNRTYFADYTTDYFSKVSPFPDLMRHALPTMENVFGDVYADFEKAVMQNGTVGGPSNHISYASNQEQIATIQVGSAFGHDELVEAMNKNVVSLSTVQKNFTMNALRNFKYANMIAEKLSRTSGTYNKNHMAFFGGGKVLHDGTPTYIGGFYQDIVFNEVMGNADENQGEKVSNGISVNQGHITNNFTCEDYGYVMTIAYIVPNTINRPLGIERWMLANTQEDVYLPEKNALPSDALYKYEISIFQPSSDKPYAFAPKFEYLKHRVNLALGMYGDGTSVYDSALFSIRTRTTNFSPWANKVLPYIQHDYKHKTFDRKAFTTEIEPLFDCEVVCNTRVIMPMPYEAKPMEVI